MSQYVAISDEVSDLTTRLLETDPDKCRQIRRILRHGVMVSTQQGETE